MVDSEAHISSDGRQSDCISGICLIICKGYESLLNHKKHAIAMVFLVSETISVALALFGKIDTWHFDLFVFLLSLCMASIVLYKYIKEKCRSTTTQVEEADIQVISELEVIFAIFQLVISLVYFILTIKRVNSNKLKLELLLPLLFNGYVVYYLFTKNEEASICDHQLSLQAVISSQSSWLMDTLEPSDSAEQNSSIEFDHLMIRISDIDEHKNLQYASDEDISLRNSQPLDEVAVRKIMFQKVLRNDNYRLSWSAPL